MWMVSKKRSVENGECYSVQKQWNSRIVLSDNSADLCVICNSKGNAESKLYSFLYFLQLKCLPL